MSGWKDLAREGVAMEVAMHRSTLRWIRRRPVVPASAIPHAYVGAVSVLLWAFIIGSAVELVALHLIIPWETVRLVADVLGIWGLLWMIGFAGSMHVHPHLVTDEALVVRHGHATRVTVPWSQVAAVRTRERSLERNRSAQWHDGVLSIGGNRTNVDLVLTEPLAHAIRGTEHQATEVRLFADDPQALLRDVRARMAGQSVK